MVSDSAPAFKFLPFFLSVMDCNLPAETNPFFLELLLAGMIFTATENKLKPGDVEAEEKPAYPGASFKAAFLQYQTVAR